MVAEMSLLILISTAQQQLQWGRDQMVAEMPMEIPLSSIEAQASMGPRPDGRGNLGRHRPSPSKHRMLQWGRDQMVAEMM